MQETFLRAWRAAGTYDRSRPLRPWLFAILRRVVVDEARCARAPRRTVATAGRRAGRRHSAERLLDEWVAARGAAADLRRPAHGPAAHLLRRGAVQRRGAGPAHPRDAPPGPARSTASAPCAPGSRSWGGSGDPLAATCEPEDLGPLLLGQLTPSRAREVARRVAACPQCSAEAADLAPVVAALRAYPPPDAVVRQRGRAAGATAGRLASTTCSRRCGSSAADAPAVAPCSQRLPSSRSWRTGRPPCSCGRPGRTGADRPADAVEVRAVGQRRRAGSRHAGGPALGHGHPSRGERPRPVGALRRVARRRGRRAPAGRARSARRPPATVDLRLSAALPLDAGRVLGVTELPAGAADQPVDVLEARLTG